jgi:hypothetical protein
VGVWLVVELGHMPRGLQAPARVKPTGQPSVTAVADALAQLDHMDETLSRCEMRFGRRALLADHPILGPLSLRQWRRFHWVHTRHHMRQLRTRAGRPAA